MTIALVYMMALFVLMGAVCFTAGRRFEREKWTFCRDCGDLLSKPDVADCIVQCGDCKRKLWGEMSRG